jgi:hypothetical protein
MKFINFLLYPYFAIRDYLRFKKRLKELRERDPFIYK